MGEARQRRENGDGPGERVLEISFDHVWPGMEALMTPHSDQKHPDRGRRCVTALDQIFKEIEDGRGRCTECEASLVHIEQMGECSIAHFWNWPTPLTLAIPFCKRCASSPEEVSRLTQKAIARGTGNKPMFRRQ